MIVIDIETTGIDAKKHAIISVGAVDFMHPENIFSEECRMRDDALFTNEAYMVHGLSEKTLRDTHRQSEAQLIEHFSSWASAIADTTLAGLHVAHFDAVFLREAFARSGMPWPFSKRTVDLHALVYASLLVRGLDIPLKDGASDIQTDMIHPYVGIPQEPKPHVALNGAKYEAEAFSRLIFGRSLFPEFQKYPVQKNLVK